LRSLMSDKDETKAPVAEAPAAEAPAADAAETPAADAAEAPAADAVETPAADAAEAPAADAAETPAAEAEDKADPKADKKAAAAAAKAARAEKAAAAKAAKAEKAVATKAARAEKAAERARKKKETLAAKKAAKEAARSKKKGGALNVVYYEAFSGRALPLLRMLAEAKVAYEWTMVNELLSCKGSETTNFAPPVVVDGANTISQTAACCMYVGKKCGFDKVGKHKVDDCVAVQYMLDVVDLSTELLKKKGSMVELKEFFEGDRFKAWMGNIERSIQGPFYFGADRSYVDFFLAAQLEILDAQVLNALAEKVQPLDVYPKITAVKAGITGLESFALDKPLLPASMTLTAEVAAEYVPAEPVAEEAAAEAETPAAEAEPPAAEPTAEAAADEKKAE